MDHLQYLLVLAGCLAATLPLEGLGGARVWRRPLRLLAALVVPVVVFSAWDVAAIAHHHWRYAARYVSGVDLPGGLPIEEVAFFGVVPICALLTFETVSRLLGPGRRVPPGSRLDPVRARTQRARRRGRA